MATPGTTLDLTSPTLNYATVVTTSGQDLTGTNWSALEETADNQSHWLRIALDGLPDDDYFFCVVVKPRERSTISWNWFPSGPNPKYSLSSSGTLLSGTGGIRQESDGSYTVWLQKDSHSSTDLLFFLSVIDGTDPYASSYQGVLGSGFEFGGAWYESVASRTEPTALTAPNNVPVIDSAGPFSISEDAAINATVATLTATDADGNTLQNWAINGGTGSGVFSIDSDTGVVTTAVALDYETTTSYTIEVTVEDSEGGESASETFTINVTDVTELPPPVVVTDPKLDKVGMEELTLITDINELKKCFILAYKDPSSINGTVTLNANSVPVFLSLRAIATEADLT